MVVGNDVKNVDSMLLVPAGCTLTARQINILNAWGVTELEVVSAEGCEDANPLARLSKEELVRFTTEVRERFWKVDEKNPVFMEIFKLALQRQVKASARELAAT